MYIYVIYPHVKELYDLVLLGSECKKIKCKVLKSKPRAHDNILPHRSPSSRSPEQETSVSYPWPGWPWSPTFDMDSPASGCFCLFVCQFLPQANVTTFKCMHTKMSSCDIHTFRVSGYVWIRSGEAIVSRCVSCLSAGCSSHPRLIISPRLVRLINSLWNKRGEVRCDHPSPPDSKTLVFFLLETLLNVECPFTHEQAKNKTKQTMSKQIYLTRSGNGQ